MSAGTVISGGFPGRVAQEVQPNQKCEGCLHYDRQAGRTGACTIGEHPWNCGTGEAQEVGYAPLHRGAGSYLPDMSNHGAHAPGVAAQPASDLHGAGSTRPVAFHQVSLGEEHVHVVKSVLEGHGRLQKSQCRLCSMQGTHGTAPPNLGLQVCTCKSIRAEDVAKAVVARMSNALRAAVPFDALVQWVRDVAKAGFRLPLPERRRELAPLSRPGASLSDQVQIDDRGGHLKPVTKSFSKLGHEAVHLTGAAHSQETVRSHERARDAHKVAASEGGPKASFHEQHVAYHDEQVSKLGVNKGERVSFRSEDDMPHVEHPRTWVSHARTSHGTYQLEEPGIRTGEHARLTYQAHDGSGHVSTHPSVNEATRFARQHHAEKTGKPVQGRHVSAIDVRRFGKQAESPKNSVEKGEQHMGSTGVIPKGKNAIPANGKTSHGSYSIKPAARNTGGHLEGPHKVYYTPTGGSESVVSHNTSHAEANRSAHHHHAAQTDSAPKSFGSEDRVEKAIDNAKHSHVVTGKLAPHGVGYSGRKAARAAVDRLDNQYGASAHTAARNPDYKPKTLKWEKTSAYGPGGHTAEAGHGTYAHSPEPHGQHTVTYYPHGQGKEGALHGGTHSSPGAAHAAALAHHQKTVGG